MMMRVPAIGAFGPLQFHVRPSQSGGLENHEHRRSVMLLKVRSTSRGVVGKLCACWVERRIVHSEQSCSLRLSGVQSNQSTARNIDVQRNVSLNGRKVCNREKSNIYDKEHPKQEASKTLGGEVRQTEG